MSNAKLINDLTTLANEMHAVALVMCESGHNEIAEKGIELQSASSKIWTWIVAIKQLSKPDELCPRCDGTGIYRMRGEEHECGCNRGAR